MSRNMDKETRAKWMEARVTHGAYVGGKEAPEHYVWRTMIARCTKVGAANWDYYGARGITVHPRWLLFENFIEDMGPRPGDGYSIDRTDNRKGYSPSNCRWATRSEQQKNKNNTKWYTDGAFTGTLSECAAFIGIGKELAHWRFKQWGTFEKEKQWLQKNTR